MAIKNQIKEKCLFYTILKKLCAVFEAQGLLEDSDEPPLLPVECPIPPHLRKE
jgi:hypothetical protein